MKALTIGLLVLGSTSSFAGECTYYLSAVNGNISHSAARRSEDKIRHIMREKGFINVSNLSEANVELKASANYWDGGYKQNYMVDVDASAALVSTATNEALEPINLSGGADHYFFKNARAASKLAKAIKQLPSCNELKLE